MPSERRERVSMCVCGRERERVSYAGMLRKVLARDGARGHWKNLSKNLIGRLTKKFLEKTRPAEMVSVLDQTL